MPALATTDLLSLAANAGFTGNDLATAVAVAYAESGGNPSAVNNKEPHGSSYGLWQIYLYAHPQYDPAQLVNDPQYNADAAYAIYAAAGHSFIPWTTYTHGTYNTFMPQVLAAIGSPDPQVATDGSADSSGNGTTQAGFNFFSPTMLLIEGVTLLLWLYMRD